MTFTSLDFLIFFVPLLGLLHFLRLSIKTWVLLIASYVFFMSGSVAGVVLILATSAIDYQIGKALGKTDNESVRKWLLISSVAFNIGILVFFKYTNFLLQNVQAVLAVIGVSVAVPRFDIPLPPGISYFTFTSMSYVLDVYYERLAPTTSASEYLLYIAYFPKLLAGPIVRARDFLSQVGQRVQTSAADIEVGLVYFLLGAVKKVVIADQVAPHVDLIFSAPSQYDALTLLQGMVGYTVQIFCDFSGYSDMAIGCARMMGIRLPQNFAMPYSAVSITEFWRRWHITLSNWFRDYVFLPLEMATKGNRSPNLRASINLFTTMLLCGLWHGANWNFVIWGGLHGGALAVNRAWRVWRPVDTLKAQSSQRFFSTLFSRISTLGVVMVGWIVFRAESWSTTVQYLSGIVTWRSGVRVVSPYILGGAAVLLLTHLILDKDRNIAEEIPLWAAPIRVAAYSALVLMLSTLASGTSAPFVYFQF
jgi:alginate O-acetyltransferase complex protein AlgI